MQAKFVTEFCLFKFLQSSVLSFSLLSYVTNWKFPENWKAVMQVLK